MIETTRKIYASDNKEYDIYNLPRGLVIKEDILVSFWDGTTDIPDLSHVKFMGTLKLDGQLPKDKKYDFSRINKLQIKETDLTGIDIVWNPYADTIRLRHITGLTGTLPFDHVKKLGLEYTDLSQVDIKYNPNANSIDISYARDQKSKKMKPGNYDFHNVGWLWLDNCIKLSESNVSFNPKAATISIVSCGSMHGKYDFSNVKELSIAYTTLDAADIAFNSEGAVRLTEFGFTEKIDAWYKWYEAKKAYEEQTKVAMDAMRKCEKFKAQCDAAKENYFQHVYES